MQAPPQGIPEVHTMVGVQVLLGRQGASFPTVHTVATAGVAASIQRPPHGRPLVHTMVGVQVQLVGQGALFPIVQASVYRGISDVV